MISADAPPDGSWRGRPLRAAFLVVLAGGLVLFADLRAPRELTIAVDLTAAGRADVIELDAIVSRGGHALGRVVRRWQPGSAPPREELRLRGPPGSADVEVTLVYQSAAPVRTRANVLLHPDEPALVSPPPPGGGTIPQ